MPAEAWGGRAVNGALGASARRYLSIRQEEFHCINKSAEPRWHEVRCQPLLSKMTPWSGECNPLVPSPPGMRKHAC